MNYFKLGLALIIIGVVLELLLPPLFVLDDILIAIGVVLLIFGWRSR